MKFKVGDRVAVYEQGRRYVGEVEGWTQKMVHVRVEEQITETRDSLFYYHEKQLRRLKPKAKREPRRVWVHPDRMTDNVSVSMVPTFGWTEFIEAKK